MIAELMKEMTALPYTVHVLDDVGDCAEHPHGCYLQVPGLPLATSSYPRLPGAHAKSRLVTARSFRTAATCSYWPSVSCVQDSQYPKACALPMRTSATKNQYKDSCQVAIPSSVYRYLQA